MNERFTTLTFVSAFPGFSYLVLNAVVRFLLSLISRSLNAKALSVRSISKQTFFMRCRSHPAVVYADINAFHRM